MKELTPITMKDIAKALKVSVATVSRALKDSPRISMAQRDKIKEYAREHITLLTSLPRVCETANENR